MESCFPRSRSASRLSGRSANGELTSYWRRVRTTIIPTTVTRGFWCRTPRIWLSCPASHRRHRALRKFGLLYYEDHFQRPNPFGLNITVAIDDVIDQKINALDSHVSQFYEWLPWVDGKLDEVPKDPAERKASLKRARTRAISPAIRASLTNWYGPQKGGATHYYEAFEICEYGAQPNESRIRELFPMLH